MPEVSIVIINFNSKNFIRPCLDSIYSQSYQSFEIIVVDNSSEDGAPGLIRESYPGVILIENKQNLGSCKARNQGISIAQGEWILTLDCDVVLERDFLKEIVKSAKKAEAGVGIFQPKILKSNRKNIYSCGISLSGIRRFRDIGNSKFDKSQFNKPKLIFGACSAAALYKKQMLEQIKEETGYFDERFFFLVEDVDLSWRAQRKGWKALYSPWAICFHSGNSSGCAKKTKQYLCFRNRYFMILKNEGFRQLFSNPFMIAYDAARILYLSLTNRTAMKALKDIADFSNKLRPKKERR